MKLALHRDQLPFATTAGGILLLSVGLGWWGIGTLLEKRESAQGLADRRGKIEVSEVLGRSGGIAEARKDAAGIKQLTAEIFKQEEAILGPWKASTLEAAGEGQEWSKDPNKWKDLLVKYNDDIAKKSGRDGDKKHVTIAPNFYLGFEEYKQKSPKEEQVPKLALQLSVSKRLVDILLTAKQKTLEGYPTSCNLLKLLGPSTEDKQKTTAAPPKEIGSKESDPLRQRYLMEFECSPEVLYAFVNALTTDAYLFVPMDISIENEKGGFPKRSELETAFNSSTSDKPSSPNSDATSGRAVPPPLLLVLAGKEKIRVVLQVDYIPWRTAPLENTEIKARKP